MTSLAQLRARVISGIQHRLRYDELVFLCPRCRRHEVSVRFHSAGAGELGAVRVWQGTSRDMSRQAETITIRPAVSLAGRGSCKGWHGHITEGHLH